MPWLAGFTARYCVFCCQGRGRGRERRTMASTKQNYCLCYRIRDSIHYTILYYTSYYCMHISYRFSICSHDTCRTSHACFANIIATWVTLAVLFAVPRPSWRAALPPMTMTMTMTYLSLPEHLMWWNAKKSPNRKLIGNWMGRADETTVRVPNIQSTHLPPVVDSTQLFDDG
ncbi:hypothetical protein F4803DRAFT_398189 [Xylaria telfairii]|nr:hypothetical protein F4803DRAFT_398189 [Xylaria telfairii]